MPPTVRTLIADAVFAALGSGLIVLIAWLHVPPPEPQPTSAAPRIVR